MIIKRNGYWFNTDSRQFIHRQLYFSIYPKHSRGLEVHHIDMNKLNNKIDNLIAIPKNVHEEIHRLMKLGFSFSKHDIEVLVRDNQEVNLTVVHLPAVTNIKKKYSDE